MTDMSRQSTGRYRVAIVHEWFVDYSGSERVVEQLLRLFPAADLFATLDFLPADNRAFIGNKSVTTTFIQRLPFARRKYRAYMPLMPLAIEQLDLSAYDIVISSNHAVAKGVLTGPDQLHICYVHSPIRYAWDLQHVYLRQSRLTKGLKSALARMMLHYLRIWDVRTAHGVDLFLANSNFIARRIRKVYGRKSIVVFPPVDVHSFPMRAEKEEFYLSVGRLVPYKMMSLIVEAFNAMPDKKLVVIGDGPDYDSIRATAGSNVEILGFKPFAEMRDCMQRAKAFVFAAEEDFGITVVEAQACGTPVIAYGKGGSLDTVVDQGDVSGRPATGLFFFEQTADSLKEAVNLFERSQRPTPYDCRRNAEKFSIDAFRGRMTEAIVGLVMASPGPQAWRTRLLDDLKSNGAGEAPFNEMQRRLNEKFR